MHLPPTYFSSLRRSRDAMSFLLSRILVTTSLPPLRDAVLLLLLSISLCFLILYVAKMSFLGRGAPSQAGGVNHERVEMAINECVGSLRVHSDYYS